MIHLRLAYENQGHLVFPEDAAEWAGLPLWELARVQSDEEGWHPEPVDGGENLTLAEAKELADRMGCGACLADQGVAEFRQLDEQIEQDRWRQAEILYELVEQGNSRRQLGRDLGQDDRHIGRLYRVWTTYGAQSAAQSLPEGRKYDECYAMVETGTDDPDDASMPWPKFPQVRQHLCF